MPCVRIMIRKLIEEITKTANDIPKCNLYPDESARLFDPDFVVCPRGLVAWGDLGGGGVAVDADRDRLTHLRIDAEQCATGDGAARAALAASQQRWLSPCRPGDKHIASHRLLSAHRLVAEWYLDGNRLSVVLVNRPAAVRLLDV